MRSSIAALLAVFAVIGDDVAAQRVGAAYVEGELLVRFKPAAAGPHAAVAVRGHAVLPSQGSPSWVHVRIPPWETVAQALASYRNDPSVASVQPNYVYRAHALPDDTQVTQLWALRNTGQAVVSSSYSPDAGTAGDDINVERAWDHITDCSSVVVAVLDSGVNYEHEDLAPNMWAGGAAFPRHGADFVDNDDDPMDANGHGTHVAGIIGAAGNNGRGVTGICWKASIMAVRVLDEQGFGTTASLTQGVDYAVRHGATVINMSLGGGSFDPMLSAAITDAASKDVAVIVAAGNDSANVDAGGAAVYPCAFPQANLLCVTALDQQYALAAFSNYGATSVDVGAPGTNILSSVVLQTTSIADGFDTDGWPRVDKTFTLPPGKSATLKFSLRYDLPPGESLTVHYRVGAGDPFASGVLLQSFSGTTIGAVGPFVHDISPCAGAPCSIGFRLSSDAAIGARSIAITSFQIDVTGASNVAYRVQNGTSMAAPQAAGLAALLRAYNPQYTYADVFDAMAGGGRPVASLAGKTTSGRALDAMSSLAHINPPTGLAATFH